MLETYFAPAAKAGANVLQADIGLVSSHPLIDGLLQTVNGLLAVLNEHRQIVAVNDTFLHSLGFSNLDEVLSLRPGEAVRCVHADEPPHGCGTTKFCVSCGAAIAIVSCLNSNITTERTCALTANRGGRIVEICLSVRAQPLLLEGRRYVLLFLQDITKEQFLFSLERTFFHDLNNLISGLLGSCQLYGLQHNNPPEIQSIINLVLRVSQEIAIQRTLSRVGETGLKPIGQAISSEQIVAEVLAVFAHHPAAKEKTITTDNNAPGVTISSDMALLIRVLCNMVTNALEATERGGEVRLTIDRPSTGLAIRVWNKAAIPLEVRPRVFQRHFSTKTGHGRGLGTYSMKLFGEHYLGGVVDFTTSEEAGTTFTLQL